MNIDDVSKLQSFFPVNDHEFLRGFTYITEGAITKRLDDVDPSWSFEVTSITARDGQITAIGHMTVCGVTRGNAGMSQIFVKDGQEKNEPEKSAVTDALKRCARLFGIGRYLLDLPSSVNDSASLGRWLNSQNAPKTTPASAKTSDLQPQGTNTPKALEMPKKGDIHDFTFKGFTTKRDSNGKPFYSFETVEGQFGFYAFSRDVFRAFNIPDTDSEKWKAVGSKIKFEHTVSCVYTLPDGKQDGYWLLNPPESQLEF